MDAPLNGESACRWAPHPLESGSQRRVSAPPLGGAAHGGSVPRSPTRDRVHRTSPAGLSPPRAAHQTWSGAGGGGLQPKGRRGKTTTTINLGAALAEFGRRVLLVDFDPQGALSVGLGIQPHELEATVYNLLMERGASPAEVVTKTCVAGMDLLPSNIDLSGAEVQLVHEVGREFVLGGVLEPLLPDYDVVLIDCQPSLGLLTVNALACADGIIVPLEC